MDVRSQIRFDPPESCLRLALVSQIGNSPLGCRGLDEKEVFGLPVEWKADLGRLLPEGRVRLDEPMAKHTTFRIGGQADALVMPGSTEELGRVLAFAREHKIPFLIVGRGSNLLVRDGGIRGIVIKIAEGMDNVQTNGVRMVAEAGVSLSALAKKCAALSLAGFEFAAGIPGSLGGALAMNAGAYGGEMKDVVEWVESMDADGMTRRRSNSEMLFSYRHSILQGTGEIALKAGLLLSAGDGEQIEVRMKELNDRRQANQPLTLPSAGSVFKRPEGHYTGPMIQDCGLKGCRVGGAEVSTLHANFIVNTGGATATDVLALIEKVRETVYARYGVWLEPEVRVVGEDVK